MPATAFSAKPVGGYVRKKRGEGAMNAAALRERVGGTWVERPAGWWLFLPAEHVRAAARVMLEGGARFSALVARPLAGEGLRLSWYWDFNGTLVSIETTLAVGDPAPSIVDIYPGADWAERETHDYYAVSFPTRSGTPPLVLREGDTPGILLDRQEKRS
jgi:hypothetical protein